MSTTTAVYIASSKRQWKVANDLANALRERGFVVTSQWHHTAPNPHEYVLQRSERQAIAMTNARDLRAAHAVVFITDDQARGALVEAGMALGRRMRLVIVGSAIDVSLMVDQPGVAWLDGLCSSPALGSSDKVVMRSDVDAIVANLPPAGLTAAQQDVLSAIKDYREEHGYPPTNRELAQMIGVTSSNAVSQHIAALAAKGHVRVTPKVSRGLVVLDPPQPPASALPTTAPANSLPAEGSP